jgi:hypothetical protein
MLPASNVQPLPGAASHTPAPAPYAVSPRNRQDPNYWDALFLDTSLPVDPVAKACMIKDLRNPTRRYLLGPVRLICNVLMGLVLVFKRLVPLRFSFYGAMHHVLYFLLKTFVTPEANYLVLRHFWLEGNIENFVLDNGTDPGVPRMKLFPRRLEELVDNAFNQHDWDLYNCVLDYAEARRRDPSLLRRVRERPLRYDSIRPPVVELDLSRRGFFQRIDLETAFEVLKVIYPPFLPLRELDRAVLSLQFDENLLAYVAELTGDDTWRYLATNRLPLAPVPYFQASRRLFEHFIVIEALHHTLMLRKEQAGLAAREG